MATQFRALGWHAGIDSEGNVLASLDPHPAGSLVAITAHLDTVLAPRGKEDISVDPEGVMLGPGVSDNGAGLAALLAIARPFGRLRKEMTPRPVAGGVCC